MDGGDNEGDINYTRMPSAPALRRSPTPAPVPFTVSPRSSLVVAVAPATAAPYMNNASMRASLVPHDSYRPPPAVTITARATETVFDPATGALVQRPRPSTAECVDPPPLAPCACTEKLHILSSNTKVQEEVGENEKTTHEIK